MVPTTSPQRPYLRAFAPLCLCAFVCFLLVPAATYSQESSALINKALDKIEKLNINSVLPKAMDEITQQTGVPIQADPVVWDLLPWGQDTNINARVENKTLRDGLELITRKLGLSIALRDEAVQIEPMPALRRLARRASVRELQALDTLASTRLELNSTRPTIKDLLEAVDKKLADIKSEFAVENRTANGVRQDQQVDVPRNATLMDALEALTKSTDATWYPWGKSILIVTKDDRIRAMLDKVITVRYNGMDVLQVLIELSQKSGVRFDIQSGAIQQIAPEARSVRGIFENAKIRQILEAIAGSTGLTYSVKDEAVTIENPGAVRRGPRDPTVGMIQLDIGIQVWIPESQISPDLREFIKARTKRELDKMKKMMEDEGFKAPPPPATNPASKPSGDL